MSSYIDQRHQVARDLLAALDILGVSKMHIFGNSLGAAIAVRIYMVAPERILSLTLCGKHPPVEVRALYFFG